MPSVQVSLLGNNVDYIEEMIKSGVVYRTRDAGRLDGDAIRFNFTELEKYVSVQIRMEERTSENKIIHRSVMRQCVESDFQNKSLDSTDKEFYKSIEKRFCPYVDDPMYKVRNLYTNEALRNSFSLEILTCSEGQTSKTCQDDTVIDNFLKKVYFTTYSINSYTSYNQSDVHSLPYKAQDTFGSQFQLRQD